MTVQFENGEMYPVRKGDLAIAVQKSKFHFIDREAQGSSPEERTKYYLVMIVSATREGRAKSFRRYPEELITRLKNYPTAYSILTLGGAARLPGLKRAYEEIEGMCLGETAKEARQRLAELLVEYDEPEDYAAATQLLKGELA